MIASETVTRVVRNPLAIPRAIVFESPGAEWRSPKPIVIPPKGKIEVELPAAGRAVQILERVPRLRDGRVSMSDLAIGEPIDVSAGRGEIVLR